MAYNAFPWSQAIEWARQDAYYLANSYQTNRQNKRQFAQAKALMDLQHQYNVFDYQHAHQWEAADLKAAGINPLMTATNGSSELSNGISSVQQFDETANAINGLNAVSNAKAVDVQKQLGLLNHSTAVEANKIADKNAISTAAQTASQVDLNNKQQDKIDSDILNDTAKTNAEVHKLDEEAKTEEVKHFIDISKI